MRKLFVCTLAVFLSLSGLLPAETHSSHSSQARPIQEEPFGFVLSTREVLKEDKTHPESSLHLDYGHIKIDEQSYRAMRAFQGKRFSTEAPLSLLAIQAGNVRTILAARALCKKLSPSGQWRLAGITQVMAFFKPLLAGYPLPDKPNEKGFLFWAETPDSTFNQKNRDIFFTAPAPNELGIESHSYQEFIKAISRASLESKKPNEKNYLKDFLKTLRNGIPAICITGQEP